MADILTDILFWLQVTEDSKRTILCHPSMTEAVKAKLAEMGTDQFHTVRESPWIAEDRLYIVDKHAADALMRQAGLPGVAW